MIAIDPGLRGSGVACFENAKLVSARYVKSPNLKGTGVQAWLDMAGAVTYPIGFKVGLVVIEQQRLRPGNEKGNPQNMMELQGVVGAIAGSCADMVGVVGYYPEQWKGTVKKEVMTARIIERLSLAEIDILRAGQSLNTLKLNHNTVDAVGIGLYHLGRLKHERQIHTS